MRRFKILPTTLILGIVIAWASPVFAQERTCDYAAEKNKLIKAKPNGAIKDASDALKYLTTTVRQYPVGGDFFPPGEVGERLRQRIAGQFDEAAVGFDRLLRDVINARVPVCGRCQLKPLFTAAKETGYEKVTERQLIENGQLFLRLKERIDSLQYDRKDLADRKSRAEKEDSIHEAEKAVQSDRDRIEDLKNLIAKFYSASSSDADFSRSMEALECLN
jgi:hypothetical protein